MEKESSKGKYLMNQRCRVCGDFHAPDDLGCDESDTYDFKDLASAITLQNGELR